MGGKRDSVDKNLSSIKARNRHDFLTAFRARKRDSNLLPVARTKGGRLQRSSAAGHGPRPRSSARDNIPPRASADTIRNVRGRRVAFDPAGEKPFESDGEDDCPPYLNEKRLDAIDEVYAEDQLRVAVRWMRAVRADNGCELRESDVDLTNGVALLESLCVVCPELFEEEAPATSREEINELESALKNLSVVESKDDRAEEDDESQTDPASAPPSRPTSAIVVSVPLLPKPVDKPVKVSIEEQCGVRRDLDADGVSAETNMRILREAMGSFQIHDWEIGGENMGAASFDSIGPFQLPGYVLFIALNGPDREYYFHDLFGWDEDTTDALETMYLSALESFGMTIPAKYLADEETEQVEGEGGNEGEKPVEEGYVEEEVGEEGYLEGEERAEEAVEYEHGDAAEGDDGIPPDVGEEHTGEQLVMSGDRLHVIEPEEPGESEDGREGGLDTIMEAPPSEDQYSDEVSRPEEQYSDNVAPSEEPYSDEVPQPEEQVAGEVHPPEEHLDEDEVPQSDDQDPVEVPPSEEQVADEVHPAEEQDSVEIPPSEAEDPEEVPPSHGQADDPYPAEDEPRPSIASDESKPTDESEPPVQDEPMVENILPGVATAAVATAAVSAAATKVPSARRIGPPKRVAKKSTSPPTRHRGSQPIPLPFSNMARKTQTRRDLTGLSHKNPPPSSPNSRGTQTSVDSEAVHSQKDAEIEALKKSADENNVLVERERKLRRGLEEKAALTEKHIKRQEALISKLSKQTREGRVVVDRLRIKLASIRDSEAVRTEKERLQNERTERVERIEREKEKKRTWGFGTVQTHKHEAAKVRRQIAELEAALNKKEATEMALRRQLAGLGVVPVVVEESPEETAERRREREKREKKEKKKEGSMVKLGSFIKRK